MRAHYGSLLFLGLVAASDCIFPRLASADELTAANVAATALIADLSETTERGRAIGVNDSLAGGVSVVTALLTGPLIEWNGLPAAGVTAIVFALVPLLLLTARELKV